MAKQVGRLKDGERVRVAGKVKGSEWYAIKVKGVRCLCGERGA